MDRNRLTPGVTPVRPVGGTADRVTTVGVAAELARLTPRDRLVLDLLHTHRTLTTDHITAIAFGSLGRARNRLNTLRQRGILDRFRHYHRPGSQSWRWTLGPVGAAIIAAATNQPAPRPATVRDATARLATSPTLAHLLGINGFFAALIAYTRDHDGTRLAGWWPESRARRAAGNLARPDAYGHWHAHGRHVQFWLEYDTGTEPLHRVAAKLDDYAHLADTPRAFPVLIWLPTALRETHLHAHLARAGIPSGVAVATAPADYAATHHGPAGPVWSLPGQPGRVALADLPTGAEDNHRYESRCDGEAWDA